MQTKMHSFTTPGGMDKSQSWPPIYAVEQSALANSYDGVEMGKVVLMHNEVELNPAEARLLGECINPF